MTDTPKPKRGRPSTMDSDRTLDVAMRAYWDQDPADVSLNTICTLAGVSKPSLYRQFGGEDGFMRAVLDRYADQVLSEIFEILAKGGSLQETLSALIDFAALNPKMETGCVFFKMRAGKHRLGPKTRQRVEEISQAAVDAFTVYLVASRDAGGWQGGLPPADAARYIVEQTGLALMQRAAGEETAQVERTLSMALSVLGSRVGAR